MCAELLLQRQPRALSGSGMMLKALEVYPKCSSRLLLPPAGFFSVCLSTGIPIFCSRALASVPADAGGMCACLHDSMQHSSQPRIPEGSLYQLAAAAPDAKFEASSMENMVTRAAVSLDWSLPKHDGF